VAGVEIEDSGGQAHATLVARLQARSTEIEEGVFTRVNAIGGVAEIEDPEYLHGFRSAVPAAIEYGLSAIESSESHAPPVPAALLTQARVAARHSVSLDTVMRRYVAGRDELNEFLIEEVERAESRELRLTSLLGTLSAAFDRLLAELGREYGLELQRRPSSTQARLAERVKALIAGERLDTSDLGYDFDAHHLGLVAEGDGAPDAVRALAKALDGRHLLVHPAVETVWAWIGLREPVDRDQLDRILAASWPEPNPLALSEPGVGISGWRLANKQARASRAVGRAARSTAKPFVPISPPAATAEPRPPP
jgi:hypothetical protein